MRIGHDVPAARARRPVILLALHAAYEVWDVIEGERLAAKFLAGETID